VLRPGIENDPSFAERFVREARALARLSHPAIVTVHDFGRSDGFYYLMMEYVAGANLRDLERSGKLQPTEALAVVPQICEALQYAHDQGVVHRDIKPENILIDAQSRVKIADFGLAKMVGAAPDAETLTGVWQVMGTPGYMAPEQLQGSPEVDHRADIYSLGVVIYEMLTGELPSGRFALPSQKVQVDVRLDEVVLRAMEREPTRRYQQASEVQTDVESICGRFRESPHQSQKFAKRHPSLARQLPTLARPLLIAAYVLAFLMFFSTRGSGGPGFTRIEYSIGFPFRWYEFEMERNVGGHTQVNLWSPAWLIAAGAFGLLQLALQLRPRHVALSVWELPRSHALMWFVVALAGVVWGHVAVALSAEPQPDRGFAFTIIGIWTAIFLYSVLWLYWTHRRIHSAQ
jgi:serine/threonine protein kinase